MRRPTTPLSAVGASLLLFAAGVLSVAAAAERWWPACGFGAFDTAACLERQDHSYGYTAPTEPWVPVGAAAELQGLALLFVAAALLLLPTVLAGRRLSTGWSVTTWLVAVGTAGIGVVTGLSGLTGDVVELPGLWVAGLLWTFGVPLLVVVTVALAGPAPRRVWTGRWAVAGSLVATNPFAEILVAPMVVGYVSHDAAPWTGAVSGGFLIVAAGFLWVTAAPRTLPAVVEEEALTSH